MKKALLCAAVALIVLALLQYHVESKKVTIHIPYRVKNVKHTHTVYKIIPHHHHLESKNSEEDDKYDFYR